MRSKDIEKLMGFASHLLRQLIAATITVAIVLTALSIVKFFWPSTPAKVELADKIKTLTDALNASARTIAEIEKEVSERQALVTKLQQDASVAQRLAAVNKEQADAVAQTLRSELRTQENSNWWAANWLHAGYTLLGIILAELYHYINRRLDRSRT